MRIEQVSNYTEAYRTIEVSALNMDRTYIENLSKDLFRDLIESHIEDTEYNLRGKYFYENKKKLGKAVTLIGLTGADYINDNLTLVLAYEV